jgi:hypothetical protein
MEHNITKQTSTIYGKFFNLLNVVSDVFDFPMKLPQFYEFSDETISR